MQNNHPVHLCTIHHAQLQPAPIPTGATVRVRYHPDSEAPIAAFCLDTVDFGASPSGESLSRRRFDTDYPAAALLDAWHALAPLGDVSVYLDKKTLTLAAGAQRYVIQPDGVDAVKVDPVADPVTAPAPVNAPVMARTQSPLIQQFEYTVQQTLENAAMPTGVVLAFAVSDTDQVVFHIAPYALIVTRARNGRAIRKMQYPPITLEQFMEVLWRKSTRK